VNIFASLLYSHRTECISDTVHGVQGGVSDKKLVASWGGYD